MARGLPQRQLTSPSKGLSMNGSVASYPLPAALKADVAVGQLRVVCRHCGMTGCIRQQLTLEVEFQRFQEPAFSCALGLIELSRTL